MGADLLVTSIEPDILRIQTPPPCTPICTHCTYFRMGGPPVHRAVVNPPDRASSSSTTWPAAKYSLTFFERRLASPFDVGSDPLYVRLPGEKVSFCGLTLSLPGDAPALGDAPSPVGGCVSVRGVFPPRGRLALAINRQLWPSQPKWDPTTQRAGLPLACPRVGWLGAPSRFLGGCADGLNGHIRSPNPIFLCHSAQGGRQTQEYSGRFPKRQLVSYFFFSPTGAPRKSTKSLPEVRWGA